MNYFFPSTVEEALGLASGASNPKYIAGGTDLSLQIRDGVFSPDTLIDLTCIDELKGITETGRGISIGAATTLSEVADSEVLPSTLIRGARLVGSPQIRSLGTIGGNICNASPCGDTLTPIIALGAILRTVSPSGLREIPAEDFFLGPKKTILKEREILKEVIIEKQFLRGSSFFKKIGRRELQSISQVNLALWLVMDKPEGVVSRIRVAVGSCAPVPLRAVKTEAFLEGKKLSDDAIDRGVAVLLSEISPVTDVRASLSYRKLVAGTFFREAMKEARDDSEA